MTRRNKERLQKFLHPRLHGSGNQTGGSLIMSTRQKDGIGVITDNTGQPVVLMTKHLFAVRVSLYRINSKFLSVTADGSLRSPTGGVKGIQPAPQNHEQNGLPTTTEKLWLRITTTTTRPMCTTMTRTTTSTRSTSTRSPEHLHVV